VLELTLQTISDFVMSVDGRVNSRLLAPAEAQFVKLYMSSPDVVYADSYVHPRYGGGNIRTCLEAIISRAYKGRKIEVE